VIYLVILVAVAAVGLLRLWLIQRREHRNRYTDIDGLRARLERVASRPAVGATLPPPAHPAPLEPARREAARRRIEARRRARPTR
jgi:hypothetical protein